MRTFRPACQPVRGRDPILTEHGLAGVSAGQRHVEGMFIHAPDLAHTLKILARNLDGTPSRYERVVTVKSQVSDLQGDEGGPSVKPSAKPTLVRTQHLPPRKTVAQS